MNKKTKKIASVVLGLAITGATLASCSGSNKSLKSSCSANMKKGSCSSDMKKGSKASCGSNGSCSSKK